MVLASADERFLLSWQDQLGQPVLLRFGRNRRPESQPLAEFVADWQRLLPQLPVKIEDIPDTELPGLFLGDRWRFCAVPTGVKLELFGEILLALDGQTPTLAPMWQERWQKLPLAPELTIFVAPHCPFCPQMVRQLIPLTVTTPAATVTLIDASLFPDQARDQDIKAVPTVIVNQLYRLTGAFTLGDLLDLAEKADPALMPTSILARLMQEGQAGLVGELMLAQKRLFPNFLPLLWHPEINIRLGAMVALETLGAEHPEVVADCLARLWEELPRSDHAVQGDLIYLLGEWGDGSWQDRLEALKQQAPDPEVEEAIEEALAKLAEKERNT
jgi:hypothetical protein